jgi:hypothetical protein
VLSEKAMKRKVLAGSAVVLGLGLPVFSLFSSSIGVQNAPSVFGVAFAAPQVAQADAPQVGSLARLEDGLTWGMSHADVVKAYNSVGGLFDREYDVILGRTQPGVQMTAIEADRENRKAAFAGSFITFGDTPTGYDATGVKDEYTYRNHESVMSVDKDGKRRFLFFIGAPPSERLWKIYDEIPLKAGGLYGASYAEAVAKLQGMVGAAPRVISPRPGGPMRILSSDWQDPGTHLRADDRSGDGVVGVVLEDKRTLSNLPQLRSNKPEDPFALDPSVLAITRGSISDPNAGHATPDAGASKKKR